MQKTFEIWQEKRLETEEVLLLLFLVLPSAPSKVPARALGEIQILKGLCSWLGSGFVVSERLNMNTEKGRALAITPGAAAEAQAAAGAPELSLCRREGDGPYLHSRVSRAGPSLPLPAWKWRKVMLGPDTSKSVEAWRQPFSILQHKDLRLSLL